MNSDQFAIRIYGDDLISLTDEQTGLTWTYGGGIVYCQRGSAEVQIKDSMIKDQLKKITKEIEVLPKDHSDVETWRKFRDLLRRKQKMIQETKNKTED